MTIAYTYHDACLPRPKSDLQPDIAIHHKSMTHQEIYVQQETRRRLLLLQRAMSQTQAASESQPSEPQKVTNSRKILERLKPEAAGRFIRSLRIKQRTSIDATSEPTSTEASTSASSSLTLTSKHLGPSDNSSESSAATIAEEPSAIAEQPSPNEGTLKRKRTDDEDELDEVAERVKRLKMERQKSLWESFDDSQFNLNSGLLYNPRLWEWYW